MTLAVMFSVTVFVMMMVFVMVVSGGGCNNYGLGGYVGDGVAGADGVGEMLKGQCYLARNPVEVSGHTRHSSIIKDTKKNPILHISVFSFELAAQGHQNEGWVRDWDETEQRDGESSGGCRLNNVMSCC